MLVDADQTGMVIKMTRELRGITQTQLADKLKVRQSLISYSESNPKGINFSLLKRIAEALECDLKVDFSPRKPKEKEDLNPTLKTA